MILEYLVPELESLDTDRKMLLIDEAKRATLSGRRSVYMKLLIPICLVASFSLFCLLPLLFFHFSHSIIPSMFFPVATLFAIVACIVSYNVMYTFLVSKELRKNLKLQS